jgi:uncharacterized protein (UPF0335 family)
MEQIETGGIDADRLLKKVELIERINDEVKEAREVVASAYSDAKNEGFDVKVLRKIIALRKQDRDERQKQEVILELYQQALGM